MARRHERSLASWLASHLIWIALLLVCFTQVGSAEPNSDVAAREECPTWFPDFRCDREGRWEGFVPPMTTPFLFEEPFITTGASIHGIWHDFPESSVFQGGDARAVAVQLRVALTDRLAFIATQDGFMELRPDQDLLDTETGFIDLMAGFKYALVHRPDLGLIVTPSLRYEMSQGSPDVLQGHGEGAFLPAISAGWGHERFHMIGAFGARLPVDRDEESTFLFYNLQFDYKVTERFSPFLAVNGFRYTGDGKGTATIRTSLGSLPVTTVQGTLATGAFDGLDVANIGSPRVDGHHIATLAAGLRMRVNSHLSLGATYERPVTNRRHIFGQRVSVNALIEL